MHIIFTVFLSILYPISLSLISFTWFRNFLALSVSPNFLLTIENVVSAMFLWLYLILSKLWCNCFLYFPLIFFLFLCLKGIIESALISPLIRVCIFFWIISLIHHITFRYYHLIWLSNQSVSDFCVLHTVKVTASNNFSDKL